MPQKEIAASVKVIIKFKEKILIIKVIDDIYDIPGGRIDHGESNIQALQRELMEELGFKISKPENLKLFHSWHYISRKKKRHYVYIVYLYNIDKMPKFKEKEVKEILWFNRKDIENMYHIPEFKEMLLKSLR